MNTPMDEDSGVSSVSRAREKAMGFWDHVSELRGTIIKSATVFVLFTALVGYNLNKFTEYVMWPFDSVVAEYPDLSIKLGTNAMTEGFNMIVQICMVGGALLSAPFILFFIGQFVAPALTTREKRAVAPLCLSALGLFLAGSAFGFFLLVPSAVRVFIEINQANHWEFNWTVGSYYGIVASTVLGVGATFQFPLLIVLLVWLGLVSTAWLRRYRRHAIVLFFIIAAIVTPSFDPLMQTLTAAPLYALYEIAILVARRMERHRDRPAAAAALALLSLLYRPQKKSAFPAAGFDFGRA